MHRPPNLDFNTPEDVEFAFSQVMKEHLGGRIDHIFLCHGTLCNMSILECDLPDFDQTLLINVRSMVHMISLAFPFMKMQHKEGSSITVLTSNLCEQPDPARSVMAIASAMVKQMVQCTALEGAYFNVRVNAVATGDVESRARM